MAKPIDLANRQQVYLERLKAGYVKEWRPVQESLRRRIKQVLTALDIDNLQDLKRKELQKVLFGLRAAHLEVSIPAMGEFLNNRLPELAAYASGLEISSLKQLAKVPFPPPAVNSAMLAFDKTSLRPDSLIYAESLFAGKNATQIASNMKPIIIDLSEGVLNLQDGRHRLMAAEKAGAKSINVHFIEYDPNDPGERIQDVTRVVSLGELPFVATSVRFNAPTAALAY